ncbi:MAG: glycogen synthase GlgA [Pirellula sp.]|nr:glycogen synthase GlgA [Pirellula sp.]
MHIAMAASEAIPFAKTGGLADVCGTLPIQLSRNGHTCYLFLPAYASAKRSARNIVDTHISFVVDMAGKPMTAHILKTHLPDSSVEVFLIDQPLYFDRESLYSDANGDYRDNCERFAFFSKAVVEAIHRLHLNIDIIHCHDWQTGLIPAYHRVGFHDFSWYRQAASVMTIHNLAYQGRFWGADMPLTSLDWQYFNWQQMEFYGDLNMLKTGIAFADLITTVSPSYAREIQQPSDGCGLDGVLRAKSNRLMGIVNGVDYSVWDPTHDPHIAQRYSNEDWQLGKRACKQDLQSSMQLPIRADVPLIGLVGRLAEQKGWGLVIPLMERWVDHRDVQWVILGNGEARYAQALESLARKRPDRVAVRLEFSDLWAHKIEAGCDLFLMPSRYEPCGLNQLYRLRYGSVPVVHATGGLIDTVCPTTDVSLREGLATGFSFTGYDLESLENCLSKAIDLYSHSPNEWSKLVHAGMNQDWSWSRSADMMVVAYQRARELAAIEGRL